MKFCNYACFRKLLSAVLAVITIFGLAFPCFAMMYVDMPEVAHDPYNIDPKMVWLTKDDIAFILDAWHIICEKRSEINSRPVQLDWELCRLCKYRTIELTVNYAHERADGDEKFWSVEDEYGMCTPSISENIDYFPTSKRTATISAAAITISNYMISKKGHRESVLGLVDKGDDCETKHNIMGCCVEVPKGEYSFSCFWFTTGYKSRDIYDPNKNNMPKYSENFKISVIERDRKRALVPLV